MHLQSLNWVVFPSSSQPPWLHLFDLGTISTLNICLWVLYVGERSKVHFHCCIMCLDAFKHSSSIKRATPVVLCTMMCLYSCATLLRIDKCCIHRRCFSLAKAVCLKRLSDFFLETTVIKYLLDTQWCLCNAFAMHYTLPYTSLLRTNVETVTSDCRCRWPCCHIKIQISQTLALISLFLKMSVSFFIFFFR